MSAVLEEHSLHPGDPGTAPVVVIGTGPVGIRFVEELLKRRPDSPIVLYGDEPWEPYNRVSLAGLLTGELNLAGIQNPLKLPLEHQVVQHHNCEVVAIDRATRRVRDRLGNWQAYSQLVLATGSTAHIPNIEGVDRPGVFTFRNLDDAQMLIARRARCRNAIVLGGGLLGLEAARGMQKYHTEVTVIEHARRLMAQQLDGEAAELLREQLLSLGIQVILGDSVRRAHGNPQLDRVELLSGKHISCDTLVIATGIRPAHRLAREAGIAVGRGVRINDQMQTSDSNIFAIGDCAEHRDRLYGLVAPGFEQAAVAAHCIAGGRASYVGSQTATRLKVAGVSLFNAGCTGERDGIWRLKTLSWRSYDSSCYRKLVLDRNCVVGAIAYGQWDETSRVQETVQRGTYLWPWQRRNFARTGRLWRDSRASDVNAWPAGAVVCQCTNTTRGALSTALQAGHTTVAALRAHTGASSVCGSCKPLLADLAGGQPLEPERGSRTLVWTGGVSMLGALIVLLAPAIPFADSVQTDIRWDLLWRDGLIKQISGFSLLGLGIVLSVISLRKRTQRITIGGFAGWRVVHVVLGTLAAATLVAHTGLRLGYRLDMYLMLSFTGLLLAGAAAGAVIGLQHRLPRAAGKRGREVALWMHILLLWPVPALLAFHVLKTYWF